MLQNLGPGRKRIAQRSLAILFEKQLNPGGRFPVFSVFVSYCFYNRFFDSQRGKDFNYNFDWQEIQTGSGDPNRITSGIHNSEKQLVRNAKKVQSSRFVMDTVKKWRLSSYTVKQGYQNDITTYISRIRSKPIAIGDIRCFFL